MKSNAITAAVCGPVPISLYGPSSLLKWFCLVFMLVVSPLVPVARAQLVSDGATKNQITATNLGPGNLTVGTNGGNTALYILAPGTVNNANGYIGFNAASTNNTVTVQNSGASWTSSGFLSVGNSGSGNQLVVGNGAVVSSWATCAIGANATANNNLAVVTGAASLWNAGAVLSVGYQGSGNQLVVSNGATLFVNEMNEEEYDGIAVLGNQSGAINNSAMITGTGSRWEIWGELFVGQNGAGNQLKVSGGGAVNSGRGVIGENSANNLVSVTGVGSSWTNYGDLFVGLNGSGNQLNITTSGTVVANKLTVGSSFTSGNRVTVDGGTLRSPTLEIRNSTSGLFNGLITVDTLLITSSGLLQFDGGTLNARAATIDNVAIFTVGNGASATYFMSGTVSETHSFANGFRIANNAVLAGNGTIGNGTIGGALTVASGGTLSPGASIGKIILNTPPVLQGKVLMEISCSGATLTSDQVQVVGALTYGGSLTVSNLGPDTLALGNSFPLFSAANYAGMFSAITLPVLPVGLAWTNQLLANGSFSVVSAAVVPTVTTLPASGISNTVATLNATVNPGGAATTAWFEWGSSPHVYGQQTAPVALVPGFAALNISNALTGLTPGWIYHARVVASNSVGVARGKDVAFGSPGLLLSGAAFITNVVNAPFDDPGATARIGPLAIAASGNHNLALRVDGTVVVWGDMSFGLTNIPGGLTNVVAISAGSINNLALRTNGTVVAWGNNNFGQTNVPGAAANATAIAGGGLHSLALGPGGNVVGWGYNAFGQCSIPPTATNNVLAIAAGYFHSVALKNGGTVVAWGAGLTNEIDGGTFGANRGQSIIPAGLTNVSAIAAGDYHSLALRTNGLLVAWGNNSSGQTNVPANATNVVAIAGGASHCLALRADGGVMAWGEGNIGQTNVPPSATNVVAIAAGGVHNLALRADGVVVAWGYNSVGQTNVPVTAFNLPVTVSGSVTTNLPGSYVLTYTATNAFGGVSRLTRTVVVVVAPPVAFRLTGAKQSAGGAFQLNFTNLSGLPFTVLTSTNVALPIASWTVLGTPVESPAGHYQFTDPQATNNAIRFYCVRSP